MNYDYSENELVQKASATVLRELGWQTAFAYNTEVLGENGTFGRKTENEILLERYFAKAIKTLNPWITQEQISEATKTFKKVSANDSLLKINEEKYKLIKDGIPVKYKKNDGTEEKRYVQVIDYKNPNNVEHNHFLAIQELKIRGKHHRRRTDIVGFVNGIPLLFIELKRNDVDVENAYTDNYSDYLDTIPQLFYYNALLMLSNGEQAKVGTLGSKYEFFHEWKRLKEEDAGNVELETMLKGICNKENFLDLLENFILFDHSDERIVKILARNHQFLGVNQAVKAYADRKLKNGKLGVFWHTQGSGKSYSMLFMASKIMRKFSGSPTILVVTDRDELDTQISDLFVNCGMIGKEAASKSIATSRVDLIKKLKGNPRFIFTLIQKFNETNVTPTIPNHEILIMSDEAHRSQYGFFANNMNNLLPTASKIGFTGTPLFLNDDITRRTFGDYVSVYDFKRAVDDGMTVPLIYENRGEKLLNIENPELNEKILDAIERADLKPNEQEKIEKEIEKEIHILTAEPRLRAIAKDFVEHYSDVWASGKAMFVCLNKVTCVRMFNFVQEYWQQKIEQLQKELKHLSDQESQELLRKIKWMQETQMRVVVSPDQNEIRTFEKWGLDILTHRNEMKTHELDKEFKDSKNPFRIVFVCAMWLTGFDVKSLAFLYLDKPLKAHTLMQTIARANRVDEGKTNGFIIDYIGIVKALREALATYTAKENEPNRKIDPTYDIDEFINRIKEIVSLTKDLLLENNYNLDSLINANPKDFSRLSLIIDAANILCENIKTKKTFQTYANELEKLMKYVEHGILDNNTIAEKDAIIAISRQLNEKRKHVDNTDLMVQINDILSEYIVVEEKINKATVKIDLSQLNFGVLISEFSKKKRQNLVLRDLQEVIQKKLDMMIKENPSRVDFLQKYQEIIEAYNKEQDSATIEHTFEELLKLAGSLDDEQKRYIREGFTNDEELSLFDLIVQKNLSKKDIKAIKKLSVELLTKLKEMIKTLDHWTEKTATEASVKKLIRDELYTNLPTSYNEEAMNNCRQKIFEYIRLRYAEVA